MSLMLQDRRMRRSRAGRRQLAFEDATRQVAFAAEWWKARQLIASTPEKLQDATDVAQRWLDEASERVTTAERTRTRLQYEDRYVAIAPLADASAHPQVSAVTPANTATGVPPTSSIVADLPLIGTGVDAASLSTATVTLKESATGAAGCQRSVLW
ncbi:hypothetical protein J0695_06530 [Streptomyces beijiangensis]|uniref:Uncharacterized protein n=1 Tax=Streptomyces beijiangensis TaxID=163361 RepID=A0A939F398_9ACTN|nr:hypothetical protein [Streptomyces beijiangensis]